MQDKKLPNSPLSSTRVRAPYTEVYLCGVRVTGKAEGRGGRMVLAGSAYSLC